MKVSRFRGFDLALMTRDEHCPPHLHVKSPDWEARFKFSFWHNNVCLYDVQPVSAKPPSKVLENLRQHLREPLILQSARQKWWHVMNSICLDNLYWNFHLGEVVAPTKTNVGAVKIMSARYDGQRNITVLKLFGFVDDLEIEL
ncbi:TPA: hypothetical protein ACXJTM_003747 [Stenotrophomonas maltophilia]|nr:hypothetical protein [Stenotrophomonas maltophilia]